MKKSSFLAAFFTVLVVGSAMAYAWAAAFKWAETQHQFGQIKQGQPVTAEFSFTNVGAAPLIIKNAYGSCGCTGVSYPHEPIMPGAKGVIKATFNAAAKGPFNKTVTIESNAETGMTSLQITGEVVE